MKDIAGVLIFKEGKFLLVQEKQAYVYGLWNLPAGHVDEGETIEEAAKREGEEETGYELELGEKIGVFPIEDDKQMHIFWANIKGGDIQFDSNELLAVKWFSAEEIKNLPLRESFIINLSESMSKQSKTR